MPFTFSEEVIKTPFERSPSTKISYGLRFPDACKKHVVETFAASRAFIIASRSIASNSDSLTRLQAALGPLYAGVYIGIQPHTPTDQCLEAARAFRDAQADCLIILGAGSLTDGGKLVRFALANGCETLEDMETLWGGKRTQNPNQRAVINQPTVPMIAIPTSLSGGEYQAITGATDPRNHRKRGFEPERMVDVVVLDPELCCSTPGHIWLSTGVRSVDHCVETAVAVGCDDLALQFAIKGLLALVTGLLGVKGNPGDSDARFKCQLGVVDAMLARSTGVPLGASHGIGHQLGPFGVGHGETSCILLPAVCNYNLQKGANVQEQQRVAEALLAEPIVARVVEKRGLGGDGEVTLGGILRAVVGELELPQTLKEVGVGREKLQLLAEHSLDDPWLKANPVSITTTEQVLEILDLVVE